MSNTNNPILDSIRNAIGAQATKPSDDSKGNVSNIRQPSNFWLNVGVTIKGKDGEDIFISLPTGIALDDMKPQAVKGNNTDWQALAQTKNVLLEQMQQAAASLKPGERVCVPVLTVELYRRAEPAQIADPASNSLVASLMGKLTGNG